MQMSWTHCDFYKDEEAAAKAVKFYTAFGIPAEQDGKRVFLKAKTIVK